MTILLIWLFTSSFSYAAHPAKPSFVSSPIQTLKEMFAPEPKKNTANSAEHDFSKPGPGLFDDTNPRFDDEGDALESTGSK